mmetsp:Transcript_1092/g.3107  ORF Transcript_1092/g.3107 Transcript_1092/m.3107 type:complete len:265 (+) Transcript_1092:481-1275(+)
MWSARPRAFVESCSTVFSGLPSFERYASTVCKMARMRFLKGIRFDLSNSPDSSAWQWMKGYTTLSSSPKKQTRNEAKPSHHTKNDGKSDSTGWLDRTSALSESTSATKSAISSRSELCGKQINSASDPCATSDRHKSICRLSFSTCTGASAPGGGFFRIFRNRELPVDCADWSPDRISLTRFARISADTGGRLFVRLLTNPAVAAAMLLLPLWPVRDRDSERLDSRSFMTKDSSSSSSSWIWTLRRVEEVASLRRDPRRPRETS